MKKVVFSLIAGMFFIGVAQAQSGVDWKRFGLEDVAQIAECASLRMGSNASMDVVATYWGPPIEHNGQCVSSSSTVSEQSRNRARSVLFPALSVCLKREVRSDADPFIRRIAYATAVIAAKGVNDWSSGKSKLSEYVNRTVACQGD